MREARVTVVSQLLDLGVSGGWVRVADAAASIYPGDAKRGQRAIQVVLSRLKNARRIERRTGEYRCVEVAPPRATTVSPRRQATPQIGPLLNTLAAALNAAHETLSEVRHVLGVRLRVEDELCIRRPSLPARIGTVEEDEP